MFIFIIITGIFEHIPPPYLCFLLIILFFLLTFLFLDYIFFIYIYNLLFFFFLPYLQIWMLLIFFLTLTGYPLDIYLTTHFLTKSTVIQNFYHSFSTKRALTCFHYLWNPLSTPGYYSNFQVKLLQKRKIIYYHYHYYHHHHHHH